MYVHGSLFCVSEIVRWVYKAARRPLTRSIINQTRLLINWFLPTVLGHDHPHRPPAFTWARCSKLQAWTLQMFQRLHDFRQIKRRYSCLAVLVHFNVTRRKIEILVGLRVVSGSERYWLRCLLIMDWLMWECCDCTTHWKHSIARAHTYTHTEWERKWQRFVH